jgi:hypothetical protein
LMVLLIVATPFFYYCILSLEVALDYCDWMTKCKLINVLNRIASISSLFLWS